MKIGISVTSAHDVDDPRRGAQNMIERASAAWQAGLDSLFVGDHHATPIPYYQNTAILGRLLAEWGERTAGALYLLPLWNPVLVAEQAATLAAIARGRFVLQCAVGPEGRQFAAMGANPRHRPSRFEEALDIMRSLWAGEEVASRGRYQFDHARVRPLPPEPIEVWIGGVAEAAIDRAARLGDGWIAAPHLTEEEAITQLALYRERCQAHKKTPGVISIRRDIYVGADDGEATATSEPIVAAGYRGFPPAALVIGGPDSVADRLRTLGQAGYTDILVRNLMPDQSAAMASIERLAGVRERIRD